ncbi:MAG: hypothetical protein WBE46_08800 [Dehalococcoidia bacterium]
MLRKLNLNEQLQHIVNRYIEAGGEWPATTREIAFWAINNKLWEPQRGKIIDICAEQLAHALREEYVTDPQGRKVRAKHAARISGTQQVLWDDIRTASREHMQAALQQRRQQIVGDCRQLKLDVDSYNENKNDGKPIQLILDFTLDIAEAELETTKVLV